jgi:hypothetical protein
VILRIVRGRVDPGHLAALRDALTDERSALARDRAGATRFHAGVRPDQDGLELITIGYWSTTAAGRAAELPEVGSLDGRTPGVQIEETVHFEVEAPILRDLADPAALRIATGRFSKPGADIEMQELIRQRAPFIGNEMSEAYVGRRLVGRAVEVTFVSAWSREPDDRSLREPFWPDIALRYDRFWVRVYTPLASMRNALRDGSTARL